MIKVIVKYGTKPYYFELDGDFKEISKEEIADKISFKLSEMYRKQNKDISERGLQKYRLTQKIIILNKMRKG